MGILLPEIVKAGHYYIAQTPLYAINEKKTFQPLWSEEELNAARAANRQITRFKGLGELSPHQLKICLLDEATRHFTPVTYSENIDDLVSLFSSAEEKRKLVGE
jgi:DNA gyrase/topoisomerase IV subunit B